MDEKQYRDTGARDIDGNIVYEGSLLRFRHPRKGLKYSHYLLPVVHHHDDVFLTFDDYIVTTEYLKEAHLYVFSHESVYNGNLVIFDGGHILNQLRRNKNEQGRNI